MKLCPAFVALALTAFLTPALHAQEPVPGIAAFQRVSFPGNSDTVFGVPLARSAAAIATVQSIAGGKVTVNGTPGWQSNQFVYASGVQAQTFHVRFTGGSREGATFTITANDATSVTLDLEGDTLTGVTAGDPVAIHPYWTLGTLFAGGAGVNASPTPGNRVTEILFPNFNATGINASANRIFYFHNGNWAEVGFGVASRNDEILYPDQYMIVRQNTAAASELICPGEVVGGKVIVWVGVNAAGPRDSHLALPRPVDGTLAESGLISSGAFRPSPTPGNRTDQLLVFNNAVPGKNKSPSAIYYYWNSAWRKVGAGTAVFDTEPVFKTAAGFIIRKAAAPTASEWVNPASF